MKPIRKVVDGDVFNKVFQFRRRHATIVTVSNDVWLKTADAVNITLKYPLYLKLKKAAEDETNQR